MTRFRVHRIALVSLAALAGCGGSSTSSPPPATSGRAPTTTGTTTSAPAGTAPGAPSERLAKATGDIPDNQIFLAFRDARLGVSLRYPEGWTQRRTATGVSFTDKANRVALLVRQGATPTAASVRATLARTAGVSVRTVRSVRLSGGSAVRASYEVRGTPNAVTGKRPTLLVDRYVTAHRGRLAVLDLATPAGVDNVDAYRMIARSLRWR